VQLNTTPTALFKEMPAAKKVVGSEKPSVVSGPRARQGVIQHSMVWVLIFSTIGAVIVLALLYVHYSG
jgi:hypothetical protein